MKTKHYRVARPRVSVEDARKVPVVPIPPEAEQVATAKVLPTAMGTLRGLENAALKHAAELDVLGQSILARAFHGDTTSAR